MSFSNFSTNLNNTTDKASNAVKIHQLHKEYHAKTLAPVSAIQMAPYFTTDFQTLQLFYASLDPPIIPTAAEQPRAAVAFVAEIIADAANNIVGAAAIPAQRAWLGGLPIPHEIPTAASMFPNVQPQNVTTHQYNAVVAAATKTKTITDRDSAVKDKLMEALPRDYITTLQTAVMGPDHITTMTSVKLMRAALAHFGTILPHEIDSVISTITSPFTPDDLFSSYTLRMALLQRQQRKELIPLTAQPLYFTLMPAIHNALGSHPTAQDIISKHFEIVPVIQQTIPTLIFVVDQHYENSLAKHAEKILKWRSNATAAASTVKQAAGNPVHAPVHAPKGKPNECHNWITGLECSDSCKTSGKFAHSPSCKGMCASLKNAVLNSRTFNSMSESNKTAAREQQIRRKGKEKTQGTQQPRSFVKNGGTIASAPITTNRRNHGRATVSVATEDDVVSSDED